MITERSLKVIFGSYYSPAGFTQTENFTIHASSVEQVYLEHNHLNSQFIAEDADDLIIDVVQLTEATYQVITPRTSYITGGTQELTIYRIKA